ncbi:MAG: undecaprenyldiphospho-muramoylpentapeptide beta-N-acetylglucosaminyltransferase [Thermodesulfobacteriota bacterium]
MNQYAEHNPNKAGNPFTGSALRIIIAGGGTGGHLFPGVAVAQEFMARDPRNQVLFVSTGNAMERSVLAKAGFRLSTIPAEGIKGRDIFNQALSAAKIPWGVAASVRIIRAYRPDVVLGVGSYSSGPLVVGAWLMGITIALHEQNMLPGMTNRLLFRFADRMFVSFENTRAGFNPAKVCFSGNPVRKEILALAAAASKAPAAEPEKKARFQVLILGGSQGAHPINMAVMEALAHLEERDRFYFVHQSGIQDEAALKQAYRETGVAGVVASFFDDMAHQYRQADLIICRAGATTVAEISVAAKAVIFIPFPHAADNHQEFNARALADTGAAEILLQKDLDGRGLARRIKHYSADPEALVRMSRKAGALGRPDAARIIVDECYRLALDKS